MSSRKTDSPESAAYRGLLADLAAVIAPLQALHRQAVEAYRPPFGKFSAAAAAMPA